MLALSIALLTVGTVLICIEMFIPGFGVCGIAGIILAVVSAFITITTLPFGSLIVLSEMATLAVIVYAVFTYMKRKQLHSRIILDETLAEDVKPIGDLTFFLGKEGITKTPLRPYGTASFNGTAVEVVSDGAYISENRRVSVASVDGQRIIVVPAAVPAAEGQQSN